MGKDRNEKGKGCDQFSSSNSFSFPFLNTQRKGFVFLPMVNLQIMISKTEQKS